MAFPISVSEIDGEKFDKSGYPLYGKFKFQGAFVYNFDIDKGFDLLGRITHLTPDEIKTNYDNYGYYGEKEVKRILYIDDTLYTLSQKELRGTDLNNFKDINSIELN